MKNTDIIIFDVESTGLLLPSPTNIERQPYLTEIYCGKYDKDFNLIDELDTMVKPPVPIPEEITKITGITQEDVDDAPSFINLYDRIYDFFEGVNYVVGHNITFDMNIMHYELFRHDYENNFHWPKVRFCTVELSKHYFNKRLKLMQLHEHLFGIGFEGSHRARADVEATAKCFFEMVKRGDVSI